MSVEAMTWALRRRAGSVGHKAVLMALADRAGFDGTCFPSQKLIAEETEQGLRTVQRQLDDLETAGLIARERRYRDGRRTTDLIVLRPQTYMPDWHVKGRFYMSDETDLHATRGVAEPSLEPDTYPFTDDFTRDEQPSVEKSLNSVVSYFVCDSCGKPVHETGRARHADCPAPALPPEAAEAIAGLKERRL